MPKDYVVALISATPLAIPPATAALAEEFPEASVWNLLDDRLLTDASGTPELPERMAERMRTLINHALNAGADGVLLSCSLYGPVSQGIVATVPVQSADEAAFLEAASSGYGTVLVVGSLESIVTDTMRRFGTVLAASGCEVNIRGLSVSGALEASVQGDPESLTSLLIGACRPAVSGVDAILLAQYSLAPAQTGLSDALAIPVISGPRSAAATLRRSLRTPRPRTLLGAIADDSTGGTDIALAFRETGLRTLLFFGLPDSEAHLPLADAIVVALKSRTSTSAHAVADALAARTWLSRRGAEQLYFKYCSTFDSTPEGNIGPVLDALTLATDAHTVVTTPSSPQHHRTVYAGHLFVDGTPLAESHMAHHPLTPMTDSFLPRVLAAQTDRPVNSLSLETVRQGVPAVRAAMAQLSNGYKSSYLLADAIDAHDLQVLALSVVDEPLVAGAVGLGAALAAVRAGRRLASSGAAADPVGPSRTAVISGSCSARTLEQIADFQMHGNPSYRLDALRTHDPASLARLTLEWFDSLPADTTPLMYSSLPVDQLRRVHEVVGAAAAAELLENALASVSEGLVLRGVRRIICAGGETSSAVLHKLNVQGVAVGRQVSPGVPWIYTLGHDPIALLLKSGNFGDVSMFSRAVDANRSWGAEE